MTTRQNLRPFGALLLVLCLATGPLELSAGGRPGGAHRLAGMAPPRLAFEGLPPVIGARTGDRGDFEREYWYWYQRSLPGGVFPREAEYAARLRATAFAARARRALADGRLPRAAARLLSSRWTELGPRGVVAWGYGTGISAGRASCLLLQKELNRILLGGAAGGIWKRALTPGTEFTPQSDYADSLAIGSLAADPHDPQVLYAGTGEAGLYIGSFNGAGLLRSTDGGDSWQRIDNGSLSARKISQVWVDPTNSSRLLVSVLYDGLYESLDGGIHWVKRLAGAAMGFAVSPADRHRILFSNSEPWGDPNADLLLSTDGGRTFTPVNGPWRGPGTTVGRISVAFAPSDPRVVWASVAPPLLGTDAERAGIYRSTDGGASFSPVFSRSHVDTNWRGNPIAVSPVAPDVIYFGGLNLYRGTAAGQLTQLTNWYATPGVSFVHADQHAIVFDPDNPDSIYVANDGGLYATTDGGATWSDRNAGLGTIQFYAGCVGTGNGLNSLFGGTQDNGSARPTNGREWTETIGGDGFQCAVDPQADYIIYGTSYDATYYLSTDAGFSFVALAPVPILLGEQRPFRTPLAIDPGDGARIYGGAQRVYRGTSNRINAAVWTPTSAGLLFPDEPVYRIAVARTDGNCLYASGGPHLARTTTGGDPWTAIDPPGSQFITGVAVHPAAANSIVCSRSGYVGGQVVRTLDGGRTWTDITANLPNVPANNVVLRAAGSRLDTYLATDTGVYYADLNAPTIFWSPVGAGLPNMPVFDLLLADAGNRIVAVTHGRGMWLLGRGPVNLSALAVSRSAIQLSWTDNDADETGLRIERKTTGGSFSEMGGVDPNISTFINTALIPGTTYTYRVRSTGPGGDSFYSNEASATTHGGRLRVARRVNFGAVRVGDFRTRSLLIRNLSKAESLMVTVTDPTGPYALATRTRFLLIPPHGRRAVTLGFFPREQGRRPGILTIHSGDPSRSTASVALVGTGR
ncbi:MAG: hypothetical protein HY320_10740 [Armatimonadetes bacterium]|nr:hypothetical protein [Armatimonadota bacterium]